MTKLSTVMIFSALLIHVDTLHGQTSVLTQHNDLNRTGWNNQETILHTGNVSPARFGKIFTREVDDQIYAQPLVVSDVSIDNGTHNIVFVATVNNSVYAFDAESAGVSSPYWQINLTPAGSRPVRNTDMTGACGGVYTDFTGNIGIVGTPVINPDSRTLYVVARSVSNSGTDFQQFLHAIDIQSGAEKSNSPVLITAQTNGNGDGSVSGIIPFDAQKQNQRSGILLLNGTVYIAYSSHCNWGPYHGWLLGYDEQTLQQTIVYNTTPEGSQGGIWMSGAAPSADELGNIYLSTGHGTVGSATDINDPVNRSESIIKLSRTGNNLSVASFFTPNNFGYLNNYDIDLGVTEVLLIPHSTWAVAGSESGYVYLVNRDSMGGYSSDFNKAKQTIDIGANSFLRSSFAYYAGASKEYVYTWSENSRLFAFPFDRARAVFDGSAYIRGPFGPRRSNGAFLAVSSNGSVDSTCVIWASYATSGDVNQSVRPGILRAFDANDVRRELWNSSVNPDDYAGSYAKFACPTIANGKVYLATFSNKMVVYGLATNPIGDCSSENRALKRPGFASSNENATFLPGYAFDGNPTTRWSSQFNDSQYIAVDLGKIYNICHVILRWETALGEDFKIETSVDGAEWTTVKTVTGNASLINSIAMEASGRFVRLVGILRGTVYGYSLYEFEVYGNPSFVNTSDAPVVYPNPAPEVIVVAKGPEDIVEVHLFDVSGRLVSSIINDDKSDVEIPVAYLVKGIYFLQVKTVNGIYRFKILH